MLVMRHPGIHFRSPVIHPKDLNHWASCSFSGRKFLRTPFPFPKSCSGGGRFKVTRRNKTSPTLHTPPALPPAVLLGQDPFVNLHTYLWVSLVSGESPSHTAMASAPGREDPSSTSQNADVAHWPELRDSHPRHLSSVRA